METFDFVIIGSGLGGLTCATILSKEGFSVCLLEKNRQFGGNLQTFSRDKCIFDTGVHYLGGLDEGQNLYRYFDYLGIMQELKLRKMDEDGFDIIRLEGDSTSYPHAMGYDNFIRRLADIFPQSKKELEIYCNTLRSVCDSFPLYRVRENHNTDFPVTYLAASAYDFIQETISDAKLRKVLAGSVMLYGGVREKSSLYQHAVTINTYIESAWKCINGGSQITKGLTKNIRQNGGVLKNYAEVKKLHVENQNIQYAELESGEKIFGKHFISNAHPAVTLSMIEKGKIRELYRQRILSLENSTSVFSLHLVFHPETFPYLNYNIYRHWSDPWNAMYYRKEEWPTSYMISTPATGEANIYAHSMTIMAYMNDTDVARWKNTFNVIPDKESDRGKDYNEFKEEYSEKLFRLLEKEFPGIRQKVRSYHSSTPLSYRDYISTPGGSMYGIIKDYNNPLGTMLSSRTKISNLLLTGQNLGMPGLLGVTVNAIKTCEELLGRNYLLRKINET